jgi:hypothetical protein
MPEPMSPISLDELQQHLKNFHERLTYLEKIALPSRVTKDELHSGVNDANLYALARFQSLSREVQALKQAVDLLRRDA